MVLGWIVGVIAVATLSLITIDLLQNNEIFVDENIGSGNGRLSPYERIEALSCDKEVEITAQDEERGIKAVSGIREILGTDPIQRLCEMGAAERVKAAQTIHRVLCTAFSIDIGLQMGTSDDGTCGVYRHNDKVMWVDYRYLLSRNPEYIEEYIDTVFHEFRHAMQIKCIENSEYNGASEDYRKRMACSLHRSIYVNYSENPELYYKQLSERDAREFAAWLIVKLKGENRPV